MNLTERWLDAKAREKAAQDERREIEDQIVAQLGVEESLDGTLNAIVENRKVKIVGRLNRKVDSDLVKKIAEENDLVDHAARLFRWTAEMSLSTWKATDKKITDMFQTAITVSPGRPSFSIADEEK